MTLVRFSTSTTRLIMMIMMCLVLASSFANTKSRSHDLIEHWSHADGSYHMFEDHHSSADEISAFSLDADHSHKHDPSDHTHDIPLQLLLPNNCPTLMCGWELQPVSGTHSILAFLLERPPKSAVAV